MIMKRIITAIVVLALSAVAAHARELKFKEDGTFKVMQLTDLHLNPKLPGECLLVFDRIDRLVAMEKPDFIAITGDMVYGKPAEEVIVKLRAQLDSYRIPWAVVYGNHDYQFNLTRAEMSKLYTDGEYNCNTLNENGELADMEIPVMDGDKPGYYIFMMDSHDYCAIKNIGTYGYFSWEQVQWLRESCKARTAEDGSVAPSLAFFHIPLCEYTDAWHRMENTRQGEGDFKHCVGMRGENIASGALNTGMFAAMKETGSVAGVFCGHEHDNDFLACYCGISVAYGRFTGAGAVYNNIPAGARIIQVKPLDRTIETWIRDDAGRFVRHVKSDGWELKTASSRPKGGSYGQWCPVKE